MTHITDCRQTRYKPYIGIRVKIDTVYGRKIYPLQCNSLSNNTLIIRQDFCNKNNRDWKLTLKPKEVVMFRKTFYTVTAVLVIVAVVLFIGCSSDDKPEKVSVVNQVVEDIAETVADSFTEATFAADTVERAEYKGRFTRISDLLIVDSTIYAVFDGGVIVYDLTDTSYIAIGSGEKFNAVALHNEKVYAGGKNLFIVNDGLLESVALRFESEINSLYSFEGKLMIGTGQGLYAKSKDEYELVREDISVSDMTADESGLWVGTGGQGLFRMESDAFKRRFLLRDTAIFNNVNCLDYNRGYVYVGTNDAFYIFDGGSWETLTTENGLPSNSIRAIDASGWVVYVATDAGVIGYFNGDFLPARKLDDKIVNVIEKIGGNVIIGTDSEGLLMKSGDVLRALVEPGEPEAEEDTFTLSED